MLRSWMPETFFHWASLILTSLGVLVSLAALFRSYDPLIDITVSTKLRDGAFGGLIMFPVAYRFLRF